MIVRTLGTVEESLIELRRENARELDALRALRDAVESWRVGEISAAEVFRLRREAVRRDR